MAVILNVQVVVDVQGVAKLVLVDAELTVKMVALAIQLDAEKPVQEVVKTPVQLDVLAVLIIVEKLVQEVVRLFVRLDVQDVLIIVELIVREAAELDAPVLAVQDVALDVLQVAEDALVALVAEDAL